MVDAQLTVTPPELVTLRTNSAGNSAYWLSPPDADKPLFTRFRSEVKDFYFWQQQQRCCYCSFPLQNDQSTYDAEHVLDRSSYPQFMFTLNNLAAACRPCNRGKNDKSALVVDQPLAAVPAASIDYRIVHPHLDEWHAHLRFDRFRRVQARNGSTKGKNTIEVCNIAALNRTRLADHFGSAHGQTAEKLLRDFFKYKTAKKKRMCLDLLHRLANRSGLGKAIELVKRLELEYPP